MTGDTNLTCSFHKCAAIPAVQRFNFNSKMGGPRSKALASNMRCATCHRCHICPFTHLPSLQKNHKQCPAKYLPLWTNSTLWVANAYHKMCGEKWWSWACCDQHPIQLSSLLASPQPVMGGGMALDELYLMLSHGRPQTGAVCVLTYTSCALTSA